MKWPPKIRILNAFSGGLIWEVMKTLGGGTHLEEVDHQRWVLGNTLPPGPSCRTVCLLSIKKWTAFHTPPWCDAWGPKTNKPSAKIFFPKFLCQVFCHATKKVTNILVTNEAFSKMKKPTNRSHLSSGAKMVLSDQLTEERKSREGNDRWICYMLFMLYACMKMSQ